MTSLDDAIAALAEDAGVAIVRVAVDSPGRDAQRAAGVAAAARAGATVVGHEDDGRPRFAPGATGSIAHTDAHAVAAAVPVPGPITAVGVDVETAGALDPEDAALVLDERERAAVAASAEPAGTATLLWSVKEAAFKAWSTATSGGLGTVDPVDIHVELGGGTCVVEARGTLGEIVAPWEARGAYVSAAGCVVTLVVLRGRRSG